jgi:hypothetical protein
MSEANLALDNITQELKKKHPSIRKILNSLFNSLKAQQLDISGPEFYDIVGETFKLNPKFFMKYLYEDIRKEVSKVYSDEKMQEMERYIIKKFFLYDGEQILYEYDGVNISQEIKGKYKLKIRSAIIYITNYRIIAQGKLKKEVHSGVGADGTGIGIIDIFILIGYSAKAAVKSSAHRKELEKSINESWEGDLPTYGFPFPIYPSLNLKKTYKYIRYNVQKEGINCQIKISPSSYKTRTNLNEILKAFQIDEPLGKIEITYKFPTLGIIGLSSNITGFTIVVLLLLNYHIFGDYLIVYGIITIIFPFVAWICGDFGIWRERIPILARIAKLIGIFFLIIFPIIAMIVIPILIH